MPDISGSLARSARDQWRSLRRPTIGALAAISLTVAIVAAMFPDDPPPAPVGNYYPSFPVLIKPLPQQSPPTSVPATGTPTPPK
ncbi:hypothetical protein Ntsu_15940 [Nocardia sp. IFM 10818]